MADSVYQHKANDGWTPGRDSWAEEWDVDRDLARFHKGEGFRLKVGDEPFSPIRKLSECDERILAHLTKNPPDTVVVLRSVADEWNLAFRRHEVPPGLTERGTELLDGIIGTPYRLGYEPPQGLVDCSGSTKWLHGVLIGAAWPHNAEDQRRMFLAPGNDLVMIQRSQLKPLDLIWHHMGSDGRVDHVSVYHGPYRGVESVWDAEPGDAPAPWGGNLGTGFRIRPMIGNYYCADIVNIGRVVKVNGLP
jgi:hypothetical protein